MSTVRSAGRSSARVLVLGATGQQGGSVARALVDDGWAVRALVRTTRSAQARVLAAYGIETVPGDRFDEASLTAAMTGMTAVFSVLPSSGQPGSGITDADESAAGIRVADRAVAAGVEHLVYSSSNAAGALTGIGHFDSKSRVEEHVLTLPIATTIVRPSTFMEMVVEPDFGVPDAVLNFFMRPDQAVQLVAVADIGHLVAAVLADPAAYAGRTIELAGDTITGADLANALGVEYRRFPDDVLAANPLLARLTDLVDDGRLAGHADLDELPRMHPGLHRTRLAGDQAGPTSDELTRIPGP